MNEKSNFWQGVVRWLPAVLYAVVIFYLSSLSKPPAVEELIGLKFSSLIKHYIEYLIFGFLLFYAVWKYDRRVLLVILIGAVYAASDEIHQFFVPGRIMDFMDFLLDFFGILTSVIVTNLKIIKPGMKKIRG